MYFIGWLHFRRSHEHGAGVAGVGGLEIGRRKNGIDS